MKNQKDQRPSEWIKARTDALRAADPDRILMPLIADIQAIKDYLDQAQ